MPWKIHFHREASQFDLSLHHTSQSQLVLLIRVHMMIEGRQHQVLVRLHQVRPRLSVGHSAVQVEAVSHREAREGALVDGLGQPGPHQFSLQQCLLAE